MPDETSKVKHSLHKKKIADDATASPIVARVKEQEPAESVEQILGGIQEKHKEADRQAEREVQDALGKEARLREPEAHIPPDVADAGVISPEKEASETLKKDTVELPITEKKYQEGEHTKISAKVTQKKEVFGISSIVALAIIVGRLIKLAHHHAKKFVFKSFSAKATKDEKGE